jgi:ABC-type phosphate transport system auxiliary subunit
MNDKELSSVDQLHAWKKELENRGHVLVAKLENIQSDLNRISLIIKDLEKG